MLVHALLERAARRTPQAVAAIEPHGVATYAELDGLANRLARLLVDSGVRRGDRVILAMPNSIDLAAFYFGVMKAGAVAVPLAPGPRSDRLAPAVADCRPAACVLDAASARHLASAGALETVPVAFVHQARGAWSGAGVGRAAALAPRLDRISPAPLALEQSDADLAALVYTSGSTGRPRGVMLSHRNIRSNTESIVEYLALGADDRVMCVLPFHYVYGLSLLHTHVAVGGSIVIDNRFMYPHVVLAAVRKHGVTGFAGVPSTFALLLHQPGLTLTELSSLRYITQAGGEMPPARIAEWLDRCPNVPFFVMYGATEASARLTYLPPEDVRRKLGSIGRPIPRVEIEVLRDDGTRARPWETGELVARGDNIARGYWNDPDATGERFGPQGYRTGDLGYADEDGCLYLVGRRHDLIKVGAHRVGAREIEDVLQDHSGVHEVAVVGMPDDLLGEVPVAVVSARPGASLDARGLLAFCRKRLPPHKVPSRVLVAHDVPKGPTGKIDKRTVKAQLAAEDGDWFAEVSLPLMRRVPARRGVR